MDIGAHILMDSPHLLQATIVFDSFPQLKDVDDDTIAGHGGHVDGGWSCQTHTKTLVGRQMEDTHI